ncbi:MAG: class I SAM-dependent methyltransferase [Ferrovibrio sp.]|uniref:class I SAM-dependent methyltransferase n=1 Tax=Ferrovibrio sp. TaxID=1917215 RepID=UPI00262A7F29|nr:class I SAM-dependent methyltransferase [Ferrovibrio sp.]MCW0234576.1 class I SAM-dependent methyltransferase [Ferrovibrio sp.]
MSAFFDDSASYFTDNNSVFSAIHESAHRTTCKWEQRWPVSDWTIDIGCGQGYHWKYVSDHSRLIGFDIRLESLMKIRDRFPDAILVQGNLLSLPFKSASIARASSVYALEHIYFLEDALMEIARILAPKAKFLIGLPCEGGAAWTLGRKLTSERTMSRRYNLDYRRYIALEHCNTAARVEKALKFHFRPLERKLFPFDFLPFINTNLTLSIASERL